MSISEIFLSFIISFVAGSLSGVLLALKGKTNRPTIFQFNQHIEYKKVIITKHESRASSDSTDSIWIVLMMIFIIFTISVILFANFREDIIFWGWHAIVFGSSIVTASIIVTLLKERLFDFAGLWTFVCWLAIVYIFWTFANPSFGEDYINYLYTVKQKNYVGFNDYSLFAFTQILGLLLLTLSALITLAQSIIFALWPIGYSSRFLRSLLSRLVRFFYDTYFLVAHAFLIILSYFYCSGLLVKLPFVNSF